MPKKCLAILLAGIFINISEFIRNELLFKSTWIEGFRKLGLTFPSQPINGLGWVIWAFIFSIFLVVIIQKFSVIQSTLITWSLGFVLMWIALLNLEVFPTTLLLAAIPWSFLEVYIAGCIAKQLL